MIDTDASLAKFTAFVELKDFRPKTKKEYVRDLCKLAEHFQLLFDIGSRGPQPPIDEVREGLLLALLEVGKNFPQIMMMAGGIGITVLPNFHDDFILVSHLIPPKEVLGVYKSLGRYSRPLRKSIGSPASSPHC